MDHINGSLTVNDNIEAAMTLDQFLEKTGERMEPVKELFAYYRCAMLEVETKFRVLNEQFSLAYDGNPIEAIKTRIKTFDSIIRKLERKGYPVNLASIEENLDDIAGIRVVCSFEEDIYVLADCLLAQDDVRLLERVDYIATPKRSGYRSLHLIVEVPIYLSDGKKLVKVEVQLRTIAMDFWASVEHKLRYKKNLSEEQMEELSGEMLECSRMTSELDHRMQKVRNRLYATKESTRARGNIYGDMENYDPLYLLDLAVEATKTELASVTDDNTESFITAIARLKTEIQRISEEEVMQLEIDSELKNSLLSDKRLMVILARTEAEQISLISTFVTYCLCMREGLPNHSPIYVQRDEDLHKIIEEYYAGR